MQYFVGIQGGATRSVGVVSGSDGNVLQRVCGGPTNFYSQNRYEIVSALGELFEELLEDVARAEVASVWFAAAGAQDARDREMLAAVCRQFGIGGSVTVSDDLVSILEANAPAGTPAMVVLSGTGSCVLGRTAEGRTLRAGGGGHLLGDEGSGYAIGLAGLKAVCRAYEDRAPATGMTALLAEKNGLADRASIARFVDSAGKPDIADVAGIVCDAAETGDSVANNILRTQADNLAAIALHLAGKLDVPTTDLSIVLAGGVLLHQPIYRDHVTGRLSEGLPGACVKLQEVEGAVGALQLAINTSQVPQPRQESASEDVEPALTTESLNPAAAKIDVASTTEIARIMNAEDQRVARAVARVLDEIAKAIEWAAGSARSGGRLIYVGAGTSGRLGVLDAAECPPTFSTEPDTVQAIIAGGADAIVQAVEGAEDDEAAGAKAVREKRVCNRDTVVGISASGTAPFVRGALDAASRLGAKTVLVMCNRPGPAAVTADLVIAPVVGPEVIAGSTRLKAGTATKLVLNMISTGAMIRSGKVYRNMMVDLRPASDKLTRRASSIVRKLTGLSAAEAQTLLDSAGNDLKVAVVMHKLNVDRHEAERILAANGRSLRRSIEPDTEGES